MRWRIAAVGALALACSRPEGREVDTTRDSLAARDSGVLPPAGAESASARPSGVQPGGPATSAPAQPTPERSPGTRPPQGTGSPQPPAPAERATGRTDTVRGVPAIVGTDRDRAVSLRVSGQPSLRLTGSQAMLVGRMSGAEVWVAGRRTGERILEVERFEVRSVDGEAVRDGVLGVEGTSYFVVLADGSRQAVVNPPAALRRHVGDRVWVSGTATLPVVTFGVIEDR